MILIELEKWLGLLVHRPDYTALMWSLCLKKSKVNQKTQKVSLDDLAVLILKENKFWFYQIEKLKLLDTILTNMDKPDREIDGDWFV